MLFNAGARILVVAAHPDDEVLGCGGTLARAIDQGIEVCVLFLGEGISARFDEKDFHSPEYNEAEKIRTEGALNALKDLGIQQYTFGTNYCCRFDTVPILSLVKAVEAKIKKFQPTIILTHNPVEVNIDHRITFRVVETATRPDISSPIQSVLGFEIVCSGNWGFEDAFKPNFYVDIKDYWDKKMSAWSCYQGEDRPFPFPRSIEGLKTQAQFRGMQSGLELAEGFKVYRSIVR